MRFFFFKILDFSLLQDSPDEHERRGGGRDGGDGGRGHGGGPVALVAVADALLVLHAELLVPVALVGLLVVALAGVGATADVRLLVVFVNCKRPWFFFCSQIVSTPSYIFQIPTLQKPFCMPKNNTINRFVTDSQGAVLKWIFTLYLNVFANRCMAHLCT